MGRGEGEWVQSPHWSSLFSISLLGYSTRQADNTGYQSLSTAAEPHLLIYVIRPESLFMLSIYHSLKTLAQQCVSINLNIV